MCGGSLATSTSAFLVLIVFIFQSHSSLGIAPQQAQQVCACTNATKDVCLKMLNSDSAFKSAPDCKTLVPRVAATLSEAVQKTLDYANSLAAKNKDPKLKRLYEGCAVLYKDTSVRVHEALEAAKAGNLSKVSEELEESEYNVHDCIIGPKELNVTDPSNLWGYNKGVKAVLDTLTCVVKFAT
uniref:Pectinesterase inhibitor domain-containing protein n=1 Tax=Kalanchoe fedtschenkoi TaxID=63787 RepID=A0A7N0TGL0_KALFE